MTSWSLLPLSKKSSSGWRLFFRDFRAKPKIEPKKCHLLQRSVKVLGYIVGIDGIAADLEKVEVIVKMSKKDIMEDEGCTPSFWRVK